MTSLYSDMLVFRVHFESQMLLNYYEQEFVHIAMSMLAVVACRCSPIQKGERASLIRPASRKRVSWIGAGGNDVSMIQIAQCWHGYRW